MHGTFYICMTYSIENTESESILCCCDGVMNEWLMNRFTREVGMAKHNQNAFHVYVYVRIFIHRMHFIKSSPGCLDGVPADTFSTSNNKKTSALLGSLSSFHIFIAHIVSHYLCNSFKFQESQPIISSVLQAPLF
jgi:hypothetical protein